MQTPSKKSGSRSTKALKPKLTDAERHKRFVDMAREVEASNDPKDFDAAFEKVVSVKRTPSKKS